MSSKQQKACKSCDVWGMKEIEGKRGGVDGLDYMSMFLFCSDTVAALIVCEKHVLKSYIPIGIAL